MSFVSPWGDGPSRVSQLIPPCYKSVGANASNGSSAAATNASSASTAASSAVPSLASRIGYFTEETLFFMFYASVNQAASNAGSQSSSEKNLSGSSEMQSTIAQELIRRGWQFHTEMSLWMQREQDPNRRPTNTASTAASDTTANSGTATKQSQQQTFIVFDPIKWDKCRQELSIQDGDPVFATNVTTSLLTA